MSRLIVLSNRVKMPDNNPMAGGLAIALQDVFNGNSVIWMGWNGEVIDSNNGGDINEFSSCERTFLTNTDKQGTNTTVTYMTTAFNNEQHQQFYCGFANNVLWPLLHEQTDVISQAPEDYAVYQAVNLLFAKQLKKIIQPDDVIWVHDYHFLSVAYDCRQLGISNRIGFFLHIPFVPLPFWQQLDKSPELINHLAYYDVFGTQTQQDKINCVAVFQHYLKDNFLNSLPSDTFYTKSDSGKAGTRLMLNLDSGIPHCLVINAYPIGVNVTKIQQHVMSLSSHLSSQSIKNIQGENVTKSATQQIIAVDRIDYSKGLLERFSGYGDFLQQYPIYQNQLKLLQIACPSRLDLPVYQQLYERVKQAVHNINQQFSPSEYRQDISNSEDFIENWQAITYSETVLSQEALMIAFWNSDVGWVNSLKDGMNLVAKEYIAAQNPNDPGVLLLSRYAGAAEQMQAALIIDPHEPQSIIHGLHTALIMPLEERQSRYQTLLQGLQQHDLHSWQQDFLNDLCLK
ncbi:trehalose-6-phosphate synthase [Psychrobacter sp. GP33]|uniref:alpha,alpha-trehalose-phosphate synthase (UDP-forming) n=1 Tax=Psychrobacter sp. GP33 TaxID=2758709 RepID=UPI0015F86C02|nr:trehalose-6-phosphate synthase [Psychrobacter sp. GP33]